MANESVENQRLDIVIVDETLQVNEYRNCCMAYFVESPDIDKIEGKKAICKFQKVELIYKDILALYSEYSSRITKRKRSGELAEVITFTSPACGSGVTSMAAAFALNCSLNNKSALYLSMENIPTTDIIFDGEGKYTLTDVVYAVIVVNDDERSAHKVDRMNELMKVFVNNEDFIRTASFIINKEEAAKFDWSTCKVITKSGAVQGTTFRQIVDILANNQEFLKLY